MVVEDDEGISGVMKIILEEDGYNVQLLTAGKAIQKRVINYSPNLILLDISMPGIDGREVTLLLKRNQDTKSIPIVVVSALNETEKIARDIGADDFLAKPFAMDALLAMAKKHIK